MRGGFTLIQISILLLAASLVLVATLPATHSTITNDAATTAKMNTVLSAMRQYETANASLPCPADASLPIASTNYGVAAANPGSTNNCTGSTPQANYVDTTNHIAIGMVPVKALGLANSYALDAFGQDITYAVDTNATTCFSGALTGQIAVTDNGTLNSTIGALISHGFDGHGAWIPLPGSSGMATRRNANSSDTDEHLVNAHGSVGGGFPANYSTINSTVTSAENSSTTFVRKPPTSTFDDIVVYKNNLWTLNSAPIASVALLAAVSGPSNGGYSTGQTLTFTVTFGTMVYVTGTPELQLSIPQSGGGNATRYAVYSSSSGDVATFTYVVQSTDYAPSGFSMSSPIVANGGSIHLGTATGPAGCLYFTPPSLTGVLLNASFIYVTDLTYCHINKYNLSGSYLSQFGSCGTGNGKFSTYTGGSAYGPTDIAADANGNLWVTDFSNNRVEEFNSGGSWLGQIGGTSAACTNCFCTGPSACPTGNGTGNGAINEAGGARLDGNGYLWVLDEGNNRVEKYSTSGSYLTKFSTSTHPGGSNELAIDASNNIWENNGSTTAAKWNNSASYVSSLAAVPGNTKFNYQAFDSSGNIWFTDVGNYTVQKYNSSGSYITAFGSQGTGNGQFSSAVNSLAFDAGGNLWVVDQGGNRVEKFNSSGSYLGQIGGCASGACSAGSGSGGYLGNPAGIVIVTGR